MSLPTLERVLRLSGRVSAFLNCEEPCVTEAIEVAPGELDLATFFGVRRPPSFRCADRFDEAYRTRCAATGTGLTPRSAALFLTDLLQAGEALERAYAADKINYQILGNLVPHLHAHIQPRFYGDAYPGQPVSGAPEQPVFLTANEYLERIAAIRAALKLL